MNSQKYCKHCGQLIDKDCIICTHCGKQVEELNSNDRNIIIILLLLVRQQAHPHLYLVLIFAPNPKTNGHLFFYAYF